MWQSHCNDWPYMPRTTNNMPSLIVTDSRESSTQWSGCPWSSLLTHPQWIWRAIQVWVWAHSPLLVWPHFLGHATKRLKTFLLVNPVWLKKNKVRVGSVIRHKQAKQTWSHVPEKIFITWKETMHGRSSNNFIGFITDWLSVAFTQKMHLLTQTNINNLATWIWKGKE